jgi:Mlc titration factor MtfA (ptsG expression regulator)
MIRLPATPDAKYERQALRALTALVGARLMIWLMAEAAAARSWRAFAETAGVYVSALALFAGAFWAGLFLLRYFAQEEAEQAAVLVSPVFHEPEAWTRILNGIPHIAALPAKDRHRLGSMVKRFLERVRVEGCNGLEVTDHMRLTIAAEACLLALNLPPGCFGPLRSVLVYPTAFVPRQFSWVRESGLEPPHGVLGESWHDGTVILAWDDVVRGLETPTDGQNVVLHEFAHQLDSAGGKANGVPPLGSTHRYAAWTQMLERNFARFTREMRDGRPSVLDPYGATNQAEFFAVATEAFFERPRELRRQYPELFAELQRYYRQDPTARLLATLTDDDDGPAAA